MILIRREDFINLRLYRECLITRGIKVVDDDDVDNKYCMHTLFVFCIIYSNFLGILIIENRSINYRVLLR